MFCEATGGTGEANMMLWTSLVLVCLLGTSLSLPVSNPFSVSFIRCLKETVSNVVLNVDFSIDEDRNPCEQQQ